MSDEDEAGAGETLRRVTVNLFHGYGYNFYREENQLRADDQRFRRMVSEMLQRARKALSEAEARYRRDRIPPPSREQPFPRADVLAEARRLEELAREVSGIDGLVAHLPVPEADKMTRRFRQEAETLQKLSEKDVELIEQAHLLAEQVEGKVHTEILDNAEAVDAAIAAIRSKLGERRILLL